jgi:EAL domain-containing protein (putative c-di-GMP-specific phosphodiesterase class I)
LNTLARYGVSPSRFEIEITERIAADGDIRIADAIRMLRSAGVRFAVDDFGRGNSSFGQLLNLEVDRIKIDKMFVDGIQDGGGMPLIEAIVQMARHKGLKTTAEGIETKEQREALTMLGCDNLQGFQLSRPLNRRQVMELVIGIEFHRSRAI